MSKTKIQDDDIIIPSVLPTTKTRNDPKVLKKELVLKVKTLQKQIKDATKQIRVTQKQIYKLSKPKKKATTK